MSTIDELKLLEKQLRDEQKELHTVRCHIKNLRNVLIEFETDLISRKLNEESIQQQIEQCKYKVNNK